MILNVTDEIIDGQPKYNITNNADGTKSIELANEVVTEGTALNRNLFNKIENVLSYQVPTYTVTTEEIEMKVNSFTKINNTLVQTDIDGCSLETSDQSNLNYVNFNSNGTFYTGSGGVVDGAISFKIKDNAFKVLKFTLTGGSFNGFGFTARDDDGNIVTSQSQSSGSYNYNNNQETTATNFAFSHVSSGRVTVSDFYIGGTLGTYFYTIDTINAPKNNQRLLIQIPAITASPIANTLNGINIDTLLLPNKFYELIYDETNNRFIAEEVRV